MSKNHLGTDVNDCSLEFIDRGYTDNLLLAPGWASDKGIFKNLDLEFNYFLIDQVPDPAADHSCLAQFETLVVTALERSQPHPLYAMGYSMGGFLLANLPPHISRRLASVSLVSVRKRYPSLSINTIITLLKRNKEAYLLKFFQRCFVSKEAFACFKQNIFPRYCEQFSLDYLINTLLVLKQLEITPDHLAQLPELTILHGAKDTIAPVSEVRKLIEGRPHKRMDKGWSTIHLAILENEGHIFTPRHINK
ncbi:hypothetical protein ACFL96_01100 [Thermoproteota archaeon]